MKDLLDKFKCVLRCDVNKEKADGDPVENCRLTQESDVADQYGENCTCLIYDRGNYPLIYCFHYILIRFRPNIYLIFPLSPLLSLQVQTVLDIVRVMERNNGMFYVYRNALQ